MAHKQKLLVNNRWGPNAEGGQPNQKDIGTPYESTFRMLPPNNHRILGYSVQTGVVELFGTMILLLGSYFAEALGADILTKSLIRGLLSALTLFAFWNWGKVTGTPVLPLAFWLTGHFNGFAVISALVGQLAGAFAAYGILVGFQPSPAVLAFPSTDVRTLGVQWGWEIFMSFVIYLFPVWILTKHRLDFEAYSRINNLRNEAGGKALKTGEGLNGAGEGFSREIPADVQMPHYRRAAIETAVGYGIIIFVVAVIGYLWSGGPFFNFWYWLPTAMAGSVSPAPSGYLTIGNQFALSFFGSLIGGAIGVSLVAWLFIWWSRTLTYTSINDPTCVDEPGLYFYAR